MFNNCRLMKISFIIAAGMLLIQQDFNPGSSILSTSQMLTSNSLFVEAKKKGKKKMKKQPVEVPKGKSNEDDGVSSPERPNEISKELYCLTCERMVIYLNMETIGKTSIEDIYEIMDV